MVGYPIAENFLAIQTHHRGPLKHHGKFRNGVGLWGILNRHPMGESGDAAVMISWFLGVGK